MKRLVIPALLIVVIVAVTVIFSVRRMMTNDRVGENHVVRHMEEVTLEAEPGQRSTLRRDRFKELEEERKAAINLAGRMAKNVFSPPRMLLEGEEHLSSVLAKEAAEMNARQLRVLVRELGQNLEIAGTDRTLLVAIMTGAWLKEHEAGFHPISGTLRSIKIPNAEQDAPSNGGQRSCLNSGFPPRRGWPRRWQKISCNDTK